MRRLAVVILTLVLSLGLGNTALAEIQWHETNREVQGKSLNDPRTSDGIEIYGSKGTITIVTPKRITVRVYTILGQMLSQATLQPGTSELRLGSRGIYLVRIGNITQKVAL
ncbi:MAG: T9SS type A sorting domain-containing protein [Muribaculaceae bacterium]|nr:T9SS type A sorting domain-containing protein [Muribaculaceae bacterium]